MLIFYSWPKLHLSSICLQAILDFFKKFSDSISSELQFVIDDITAEDSSAVGVTWHLGILKNIFCDINLD